MESHRQPSKRRTKSGDGPGRGTASVRHRTIEAQQLPASSGDYPELGGNYARQLQGARNACSEWLTHTLDAYRNLELSWKEQERAAFTGDTDTALVALEVMSYTSQAMMYLDKERIALETQLASLDRRREALSAYQDSTLG